MSSEVQATSIDAVVSKESSCSKGYFTDPFLPFFVPERDRRRRSPLINRGYYARFRAFDLVLKRFDAAFPDPAQRQVVSLGGGSETIWFRLKLEHRQPKTYLEFDLGPITQGKAKAVLGNVEMASLLGKQHPIPADSRTMVLDTDEYKIITCDLTDTALFQQLLGEHLDLSLPTLFISECVLVYVDPAASAKVLSTISSSFPVSFVVSYEQINPHDAFGKQMVRNLQSRGCALLGLEAHPDLASQEARFRRNGFPFVKAIDMKQVYYDVLAKQDRARVERLEIFDEFEEFFLIMQHYALTMGSTVDTAVGMNLDPEGDGEL